MTAAMLVLEPIFEADLPLEIYAYRAGPNAQQAAVEVDRHVVLAGRAHNDLEIQSLGTVDRDPGDVFLSPVGSTREQPCQHRRRVLQEPLRATSLEHGHADGRSFAEKWARLKPHANRCSGHVTACSGSVTQGGRNPDMPLPARPAVS
jgi:hypothetical protein